MTKLLLTNFRNHQEAEFSFGQLTVLVGRNGAGKTNVLEAVSFLSTTRSWRAKSDVETITFNEPFARLTADDLTLTLERQPYRKRFTIDGVARPPKEVIGHLKTVLFEPEDLQLVLGPPSGRRHFMNVVLAQADRSYSDALIEYRRVVAQRNHLLKMIGEGRSQPSELNFWDLELVRLAAVIWQKRAAFVALAERTLPGHYRSLSGDQTPVALRLVTHPLETDRLEEELVAVRDREIAFGQTLRGPHRDDLLVKINEVEARPTASRGEVRSLTFALKMVELDYLTGAADETATGSRLNKVVLLLDDVTSELDAGRRQRLVEAVGRVQTVLTTTDLDHIPPSLRDQATIVNIT